MQKAKRQAARWASGSGRVMRRRTSLAGTTHQKADNVVTVRRRQSSYNPLVDMPIMNPPSLSSVGSEPASGSPTRGPVESPSLSSAVIEEEKVFPLDSYEVLDAAIESFLHTMHVSRVNPTFTGSLLAEFVAGNSALVPPSLVHGVCGPATVDELGQRLMDADLLYSQTHKTAFVADASPYTHTKNSSKNPDAPKFSMSMFFFLKKDPRSHGCEVWVKGTHAVTRAYGLISLKELTLYLFSSLESPKPRRAVLLKDVTHVGAREDEDTGRPTVYVSVSGHDKPLVLGMINWDIAQDWLETLTQPNKVSQRLSTDGKGLRGARQRLMQQRQAVAADRSLVPENLRLASRPTDYDGMVEEAKRMEKSPLKQRTLAFRDVLETPHFRYVLRRFMEKNWCAENLSFLDAEEGFEQLFAVVEGKEQYEIREAALAIFKRYLAPDAPDMVNVDSSTFEQVRAAFEGPAGSCDSHVFDEARDTITSIVQRDVFPRFQQSDEYQAMMENPDANSDASVGHQHRKTPSWSLVAIQENTNELRAVVERFRNESEQVRSRRYHLVKYKDAFKGSHLVDWLLQHGYASNRLSATSIGMRMMDAALLVHVTREHDFEDSTNVFYTLDADGDDENGPSVTDLLRASRDGERCYASELLLKGVRYVRVFAVLHKRRLYLFRNRVAARPMRVVHLRHVTQCQLVTAAEMQSTYLHFEMDDKNMIVLRTDKTAKGWQAALLAAGVKLDFVTQQQHVRRNSF